MKRWILIVVFALIGTACGTKTDGSTATPAPAFGEESVLESPAEDAEPEAAAPETEEPASTETSGAAPTPTPTETTVGEAVDEVDDVDDARYDIVGLTHIEQDGRAALAVQLAKVLVEGDEGVVVLRLTDAVTGDVNEWAFDWEMLDLGSVTSVSGESPKPRLIVTSREVDGVEATFLFLDFSDFAGALISGTGVEVVQRTVDESISDSIVYTVP